MEGMAGRSVSEPELRIALVGTYPPRRCGIATFTRDLAAGLAPPIERVKPMAVAVTDRGGPYEYPAEVGYEIRQGTKGDYARAAELVNYKRRALGVVAARVRDLRRRRRGYILDLLSALRVPSVVTLHTVLEQPVGVAAHDRAEDGQGVRALVVMSQVARICSRGSTSCAGERIHIIPHGIPDMAPRDQNDAQGRFGVAGHRMLLTFGLLGPNKGIETVIRALPAMVAEFPDLVYFVVGATHPAVIRHNGEAYRTTLEREAERLGVRDHVVFRDQYVTPRSCATICRRPTSS